MGGPNLLLRARRAAALAVAAPLALSPAVPAAQPLTVSAGWLSDKVVRGLSQSGGHGVWVLDGAWSASESLTLNAGTATLGGRPRADAEWTLGAGLGGELAPGWAWQVSATRYGQWAPERTRRPAYDELGGVLHWQGRLRLALDWAPRYAALVRGQALHGRATSAAVSWQQPLGGRWVLDAGLGRVTYSGLPGFAAHAYGSVALGWQAGPLQLFASRVFSNSGAPSKVGPRPVLALSVALSP